MSTLRGIAGGTLLLFLAACGGGGTLNAVPPARTADGAPREVESTGTVTPTLYVSGQGTVYVYGLNDAGTTAPSQIVGSFYSAADPNPTAIAGIATDRKGDLYVLQNYGGPEGPYAPSCQVWGYTIHTNGALVTPAAKMFQCVSSIFFGAAIQTAPLGGVDVLDSFDPAGQSRFQVEHFFTTSGSQNASGTLTLPSPYSARPFTGLAAGALGKMFLTGTYAGPTIFIGKWSGSSGSFSPLQSFALTAQYNLSGPAAAGAGFAYSGARDTSGQWTVLRSVASSTSINAILGPYPLGTDITAMAVDLTGNLYVGFTTPGVGTAITVYSSTGLGFGVLHTLTNPVRRANPANDGGAVITGIAIAQ